MSKKYEIELTYSGKNIFTITVDGIPYSKRFSGNWDGRCHLNYILESKETAEDAIAYLSAENYFSTLYPVAMNSYLPFIKNKEKIDPSNFYIKDGLLTVKGSFEVDTGSYFDEDDDRDVDIEPINIDDYVYDHIDENGIHSTSKASGSCDGSYYFNTVDIYPIIEETELYFLTSNELLYFKGVKDNGIKILFAKDKLFLEDFLLTDEFKSKILNAWCN